MTHTLTISAHATTHKPNRVFVNPFKWVISSILHAEKSYHDRQNVMRLSHHELKDVGLNKHDNYLIPIPRNDLPYIAPNDFEEKQ